MFYGSRKDKIVEILGLVGIGAIVALAGRGASRLAFGAKTNPNIDPGMAKALKDIGANVDNIDPDVLEALRGMREGNKK